MREGSLSVQARCAWLPVALMHGTRVLLARDRPRLRELQGVQSQPEPGALGSVTEPLSPEEHSGCTCRLC